MLLGFFSWLEISEDLSMQKLAWQTSLLMTATGNYKSPIKADKLYDTLEKRNKSTVSKEGKVADIEKQREEIKKTFGL